MADVAGLCARSGESIREVMARIDRNAMGIALIVDGERRLLGTVTDGDIRRAILAGLSLNTAASELFGTRKGQYAKPTTALVGTPRDELLRLMRERSIRHLPLLDGEGRVADVLTMDALVAPARRVPVRAVVMAGGFGTRLKPLTDDVPKPMLPVGDRPLLQRIVEQLRDSGIRRISMTTHYMGEKIMEHFRDGAQFGVAVDYVAEDRPLGTAGSLSLVDGGDDPLLVINGDILTDVDFRAMHEYHVKHEADLTVAVRQYELQVPYGVMDCDGARVVSVEEKPQMRFLVSAGIYLMQPSAHRQIPNEHFDMPDLIRKLIAQGRRVVSYPIIEYWLDIGQAGDYQRAQEDARSGRIAQ